MLLEAPSTAGRQLTALGPTKPLPEPTNKSAKFCWRKLSGDTPSKLPLPRVVLRRVEETLKGDSFAARGTRLSPVLDGRGLPRYVLGLGLDSKSNPHAVQTLQQCMPRSWRGRAAATSFCATLQHGGVCPLLFDSCTAFWRKAIFIAVTSCACGPLCPEC